MKYILPFFMLFLFACKRVDIPLVFTIKGQVQTLSGSTVSNVEGYVCVDVTIYKKGKYITEKTCGTEVRSATDGVVYADLYADIEQRLWLWQNRDSIQIVDYQVYMRSEGKIIRGEFPEGKPAIEDVISKIGETTVVFIMDRASHEGENFYEVEFLSNYDGDTITFNIPGIHPFFGQEIPIRINGIQTAEIRTSDACEKNAAIYARDEVRSLLENSIRIDLLNIERGKYFRIVADVSLVLADETVINLAEYMLENKLGVYYEGDTKPEVDWCEFPGNI